MGDRWLKIDPNEEQPDAETLRRMAEIALGLVSNGLTALQRADMEVGSEIYESLGDEDIGREIEIPRDRVVREASIRVYDNCEVYFRCLRDSLSNVILDIEKYKEQLDVVNSDGFWRAFVAKAANTANSEPQLWDFKETLTFWRAENSEHRQHAKVTFAEDVASFANARGGVLVVGVTDNREIVGVGQNRELENRLKLASDALAKHLEYGRDIWRFRQVAVPDEQRIERPCLVVVIAQACEVVGVNDGGGKFSYPVRRETGIERVSPREIGDPKVHMKSDNFDFLRELQQFVQDR